MDGKHGYPTLYGAMLRLVQVYCCRSSKCRYRLCLYFCSASWSGTGCTSVSNHLHSTSTAASVLHCCLLLYCLAAAVELVLIGLAREGAVMTDSIAENNIIVVAPMKGVIRARRTSGNCRLCILWFPAVFDPHSEIEIRGRASWRSSAGDWMGRIAFPDAWVAKTLGLHQRLTHNCGQPIILQNSWTCSKHLFYPASGLAC